jgi:hypothetical protein
MPVRLALAILATLLLAPSLASARPIPLPGHAPDPRRLALDVLRGHGALPAPPAPDPANAFTYEAMDLDVTLDPHTGAVDATAVLTFRGESPTSPGLYLLLDQGLAFESATAEGYQVDLQAEPYPPFTYAAVSLSPDVPTGSQVVLVLRYRGILECAASGARSSTYCSVGSDLNHFMDGGPFPMLMDGRDPYGLFTYRRTLTLRQPSGSDVLVSADPVGRTDDGTTLTTEWQADPLSSRDYFNAVTGAFVGIPVVGPTPPFTVYHVAGQEEWAGDMAAWTDPIVAFLDDQAGAAFPYGQVGVVKLPWIDGFPGTATYAMVYLSDSYAALGPEGFEETLAHEISHLWWGILVTEVDNSYWLVEGLAVLSQYDYTWAEHRAPLHTFDHDTYLADRYRWNGNMLRYLTDPATLPPLVLPESAGWPDTVNEQVVWSYFKSSATLDHLRVLLGDDVFAAGLRAYRDACTQVPCDTADFQAALEETSGQDLQWFVDQLVHASSHPDVSVDFVQTCDDPVVHCDVTVELGQSGTDRVDLVLRAVLEDGSHQEHRVSLVGVLDTFTLTTPGRVVAVRPHPRHDALVWSRSATEADVTFDRDVDGFDLIHCALQEGRRAVDRTDPDAGIWDVDMIFDSRCDLDGNGVIDAADLTVFQTRFGTVRTDG